MKYVKLVAKPDTWFKAGTEVFEYNGDWSERRRVTLEEWEQMVKDGMYCLRGERVCDSEHEAKVLQCDIGEEYIDGECGNTDEFEITIVDSPN